MQTTSENIIKAYNIAKETGADSTCKVLEALYPDVDFTPKDNHPVTERIKTFEDAVAALGEDHPFVKQWNWLAGCEVDDEHIDPNGNRKGGAFTDILAYLKIRIITAALNEGWEPQFTDDEWRYYPWFYLWSEEELANNDDEWKQARSLRSCENHRVLFGGSANYGADAYFAYSSSNYAPSYTTAYVGSRLCFKSEDLAVYAGKQFIDLYMDFNLICK